jgi:hypothetical protein
VDAERPASVASLFHEGQAELGGKKRQCSVKKTYSFRKGGLSVDYDISNLESKPFACRVGVEFNFSAGYSASSVGLAGIRSREEIPLETNHKCQVANINGLRLSNLAKNETIELRSDFPFSLSHTPVFSDIGLDTIPDSYQGCNLLLGWDFDFSANSSQRFSITLELRS